MAKRKKKNVKEETKEVKEPIKIEEKEVKEKDPEEVKRVTNRAKMDVFMENLPFLILIAFIIVIRIFIASPVRVQQNSMEPTLEPGNILLLYKLKKNIKGINRFDIVVLKSKSGDLVKRVIGLPGETIKYEVYEENGIIKNALYVDGKKIEENFVADEYKNFTCDRGDKRTFELCTDSVTLGDDEYFVMGDNRKVSYDSRDMGAFKKNQIKGIAEIRLFPFDKFGRIEKKK